MVEARLARLAAELWELAGLAPVYPVAVESLVAWALPLAIEPVPALSVTSVRQWAERRRAAGPPAGDDRPLHGCLLTHRGKGIIFVDAADPPEQRRFTLAHEAAHFLIEYRAVRQRAEAALGPAIRAVLDGDRLPTREERIDAVLSGFALGPHVHFMERGPDGDACRRIAEAECAADALAVELLAPEELAATVVAGQPPSVAAARLRERFGLPASVAAAYARRLARQGRQPRFERWLAGHARS